MSKKRHRKGQHNLHGTAPANATGNGPATAQAALAAPPPPPDPPRGDEPPQTHGDEATPATAQRHGSFKEIIRFVLTVLIIVTIQLVFDKVVFLKIDDDTAFKQEVVEALESIETVELWKLWLESFSNYEEPIASTPEYRACMKENARDQQCASEAREQRSFVKPPKEQYQGMTDPNQPALKMLFGAGRVLGYLYFAAKTDGQRFVAVVQLLLGVGFSGWLTFFVFNTVRERTADDYRNGIIIVGSVLVGAFVFTSLLAYPIRWLGLATFAFIPGVYGAALLKAIEKGVDGLMHVFIEGWIGGEPI
jgi:hypothetical protein